MIFKYSYLRQLGLLVLFLALVAAVEQCGPNDQEFFITFHPHLDAFWLNTDDQLKNINFRPEGFLFAMNQRNSKQIFNTMLDALLKNATRKFFVTQAVFFKDWYDDLPAAKKAQVKEVLKNGQLQITNGGWVENDEAVCYVDDIIDQYTVGHNFFYQEFGIVPTIAWATDSFGHSHSQAAIEHLLGFEIQGIERIDDRYIFKRKGESLLQFYWSAVSDSNGHRYGGVYTHIRHFLHEFVDYRRMASQSVADDHSRIEPVMKKLYRRNKLFRFVGNDFQEFAPQEFDVLQKSFAQLNANSNTKCSHFKYGNPSDYFKYVKSDSNVAIRENDFLPNFDQDHYWSGYYTTNPELKIVCKDFSRLLNLFRKLYVKYLVNGGAEDAMYRGLLQKADELVAVMQHHDGITATSKYHIQELFKRRMRTASDDIIRAVAKLKGKSAQTCNLYTNGNKCSLASQQGQTIYLSILHEGSSKTERLEITLPARTYYEAEEDKEDSIFCPAQGSCVLIFEAQLHAGENVFKLNMIDETHKDIIVQWKDIQSTDFEGQTFSVAVENANLKLTPKNGQFISLTFVRSANTPSNVETTTWNKFGQTINKNQRRVPGIYIMSNNGQIQQISDLKFRDLRVAIGRRYSQVSASSLIANVLITFANSEINIVDVEATFKPNTWQMFDYFLKVDSTVKSQGSFYHDVNGYLVSQRKIGERLDYDWIYRNEDKINANNYPMCSFGYVIQGDRKMIVFTDRAQGLTLYDESLLINIDRLAGDDYKGVGEGYNKQISNTFKFKVGIIAKDNNIERLWQRQYDEALVGFTSGSAPSSAKSPHLSQDKSYQMLKYTMFSLSANQFVIRLFNMNEREELTIPKYADKEWKLNGVGLSLTFQDIKEAFANGIPLGQRKVWKNIPGEINVFNAGSKDTHEELVLQPLQIRSFRINLKGKIPVPQAPKSPPLSDLASLTVTEGRPLRVPFAKRCF